MSSDDTRTEPRSRGSVVAELLCVTGAALLAFAWIVPAQVSGGGLGLDPGFLPRVCAGAIGVLTLVDGLLRLMRDRPAEAYPTGWSALVRVGGLAVLGIIVMQLAGISATALIAVPIGMVILGERRPLLIVATTAIVAGALRLFQL